MGDRPPSAVQADKPSQYVTSHPGQHSLLSLAIPPRVRVMNASKKAAE